MIQAATGFSENTILEKAALEATNQALERGGFSKVDVLLVFAALHEPNKWEATAKKLKSLTGAAQIVGGSAFGILTEQTEIEQRSSVAVMALSGAPETLYPFLIPHLQENNFRAGSILSEALKEVELDPSLT